MVSEYHLDSDVLVQRYCTQAEDGGSGAHHIRADPGLTSLLFQGPLSTNIIHDGKGHHEESNLNKHIKYPLCTLTV